MKFTTVLYDISDNIIDRRRFTDINLAISWEKLQLICDDNNNYTLAEPSWFEVIKSSLNTPKIIYKCRLQGNKFILTQIDYHRNPKKIIF